MLILTTSNNNGGEACLEDKELCNVDEVLPTMCPNIETFYKACEYAAFYTATVSLLPTHREETNRVVVRNRRTIVSLIDWTGWVHEKGLHKVTMYMRKGYEIVCRTNRERNAEAGVPEGIRKTGIKPGGTTPKLAGKTPGVGYPTFRETLRRIRVAANNVICPILDAAGIPWEPDFFDKMGTRIYEYPTLQGPVPPASEISLWEQAFNLITVQREWADNAVSNTLYFRPKWKLVLARSTFCTSSAHQIDPEMSRKWQIENEFPKYISETTNGEIENPWQLFIEIKSFNYYYNIDKWKIVVKKNKYEEWELYIYQFDPNHEEGVIEKVLSAIVPLIKSCSLLPHSTKGAYRQMPEEGISREEYERRLTEIKEIDWSDFSGSDGLDEKYCQGDQCILPGSQ